MEKTKKKKPKSLSMQLPDFLFDGRIWDGIERFGLSRECPRHITVIPSAIDGYWHLAYIPSPLCYRDETKRPMSRYGVGIWFKLHSVVLAGVTWKSRRCLKRHRRGDEGD